MTYPETFEGFACTSTESWSKLSKFEITPKVFGDYDVDIKIECCGVCGSDVHTVRGGWRVPPLPLVVGHEIVGTVLKTGPKVTLHKVGDRVGVGAQIGACLECKVCKSGNEIYCPKTVHTFGNFYEDGTKTQGGYASHIRAHEFFTFPIPKELTSESAAPFLCAGITVFSPLKRNGCGPGKKVGIVGIGGLGHFAIMFAKAMGAEVYVFSRTNSKKEDAFKLGADHYIATAETPDFEKDLAYELDFILSTANSNDSFGLDQYLKCLTIGGKFVSAGLPEKPFTVTPRSFMANACFMGSSHLGSRTEMLEMLNMVVEKGIQSWIETVPISEAGCKEVLERCYSNDVKYRFVLTDYEKQFGK